MKDVFLTCVFKRSDCNKGYWKEQFVYGLPYLFSQRIKQKIKEELQSEEIPWKDITYGQLTAFIKKEGLALCSELKIQAKYGREKGSKRKELGNFCEAFGIDKIKVPSNKKKNIKSEKEDSLENLETVS